MSDDMTYQEIARIKSNIQSFVEKIDELSQEFDFDFQESDRSFFAFIAKHIVFFKYLSEGDSSNFSYKVLISDFYYMILAIVKGEVRYMYVNERSIIENYLRSIMDISVQDNHVTDKVFQELRQKQFHCNFDDTQYSLIRSEYRTSCGYIHGSNILNDNLALVLDECINKRFTIAERKKYYIRIQSVLKSFNLLLISENALFVSGCFHRKKSVLSYLIGKEPLDLLFQIVN